MNLAPLKINSRKYLPVVVLVLLCLLFVSVGMLGINAHRNVSEMDTFAYISTALDIKHQGFLGFIASCFKAEYKQANRHPLYMVLLSPVAAHNILFIENDGFYFLHKRPVVIQYGLVAFDRPAEVPFDHVPYQPLLTTEVVINRYRRNICLAGYVRQAYPADSMALK